VLTQGGDWRDKRRKRRRRERRAIYALVGFVLIAVASQHLPHVDTASIRSDGPVTTWTLPPRTTTTRPPYLTGPQSVELGPTGAGVLR
jgi:hypothetical protein